ncbi:hypothetical protein FRC07_008887, partial [Ceratobasidium sp. 392]
MIFLKLGPLLAFTGLAAAQATSILGLSDSCNKAFGQTVATGPAASCLNSLGMLNVITTPSGQSWMPAFNSYLTATCSQPACTNETIQATSASLQEGCNTDLAGKGWSISDIADFLSKFFWYYMPVREVLCLRDNANNEALGIITLLTNYENMIGQPLNAGTLVQHLPSLIRSQNWTIPANISCTTYTQGAYTLTRPQLPSDESVKAWDKFWTNMCGQNFISGNLPTSIAQTANPNVTTEVPQPTSNDALAVGIPSPGAVFGSLALVFGSMLTML